MAATGLLWALTGKLSKMQIMTLVLVVVMGGLSVWLNDERFFKMKTTIVYGTFAVILGVGLMRGRSLLQWVMAEALPMKPEGWMILTRRLALMFAAMSILAAAFSLRLMRLGDLARMSVSAVILGFAFFFLNQFSSAMGSAEVVAPFVAAWLPPVLTALAALTLLFYTEDG